MKLSYLQECFILDVATGVLVWRVRPDNHFSNIRSARATNTMRAGHVVGSKNGERDRLNIHLAGRYFLLHRVVYALTHGLDLSDVPEILDHIDGDSFNNRPSNLRPATAQQNSYNRKLQSNNRLGVRGVKHGKGYRGFCAYIKVNGKDRYLGSFKTKEDASARYEAVAKELHGEFYRVPIPAAGA